VSDKPVSEEDHALFAQIYCSMLTGLLALECTKRKAIYGPDIVADARMHLEEIRKAQGKRG
jgi:hypothetical protein